MMQKISLKLSLCTTALFFLAVLMVSCTHKDEFIETISTDKTKPAAIENYAVIDFNGGSYIVYSLPQKSTGNILYVKAKYDLKGGTTRPQETRSSYFSDTITVEGFDSAKEYNVQLTVVSRANVESDPITVKVHPKTPVYQLVASNLALVPDFQGVRVQATNVNSKNVGIVFLDNFLGNLSIRQQNFTAFSAISYAVRGYDTIPRQYAAYVTDKWGNKSDTIFAMVKPLFEKTLDKTKFSAYALPNETPIFVSSTGVRQPLTLLWDKSLSTFWHTTQASNQKMPVFGTFKIGNYVKLSRFKLTPRSGADYIYKHGAPRVFSLWGSEVENPGDFAVPLYADTSTRIGQWVNMGNYTFPDPPSGAAPSSPTEDDKKFFNAGVEFEVPFSTPKIRVLRLVVSQTWVPGTFTHLAEIDIFGDDR